jgi:hypothetical protein
MSSLAGRWSIGGGDAAAGADGSCQQNIHEDGPAQAYGRKLTLARVCLLEHLVAARRSTDELEAALAELEARGRRRPGLLW